MTDEIDPTTLPQSARNKIRDHMADWLGLEFGKEIAAYLRTLPFEQLHKYHVQWGIEITKNGDGRPPELDPAIVRQIEAALPGAGGVLLEACNQVARDLGMVGDGERLRQLWYREQRRRK